MLGISNSFTDCLELMKNLGMSQYFLKLGKLFQVSFPVTKVIAFKSGEESDGNFLFLGDKL